MPQYKQVHLTAISRALNHKGHQGLANTIYWWNCQGHLKYSQSIGRADHIAMLKPLKDMPLFINDSSESVRTIAATRLKLGR